MKINRRIAGLIPALLVAGYLIPSSLQATIGDSERITQLLAEAKAEALELKHDSAEMESFTKSKMSWESYAHKIELVKGHVNKAGELLAKMKDAEAEGAPWQQTAIQRIEPLLKELADNTTATITRLNAQPSRVHLPEFRDYVRANYELASDLESLIRDYVNYGEAKGEAERLGESLEVNR